MRLVAGMLAALAVIAAPAHAQVEKPAWAHEASDIAPDPAVKFGVLPNGMRYALRHNALPKEAVSIRVSVAFGSIYETEDEKGLAHFIEHMAFNGSTHVPEGEMVKVLERLGLSFGADTNASTGQDFTTYMLDLPSASDALVDESLFLLREAMSELLFNAEAIDRERGVVLAEWRRGDNFQRRRQEQQLAFLLPGALAAERMPIGEASVLETATREQLVSLYRRYYRPERATIIVVGDFDVAAMEQKITTKFGDWAGVGEAGKEPERAYTPKQRAPEASVFVHEDGGDSIAAYVLSPWRKEIDTGAQRREDNLLMFATGAINRRLAPMINAEDPPFRGASIAPGELLKSTDLAQATASFAPGKWKPALQAVEKEWRRALLFGFTQTEIDAQIAALRTSQQNQAERQDTRTTAALMNALLSSVQNETVFATPASGLARFETWAGDVTPEMVHEIFVRRMGMDTPLFFMGTTVDETDLAQKIVAAWSESAAVKVEPPVARSKVPFAYTDFGKPGKVVKDTRIADLDVRLVTFENNVRLNIKKTDFQRNTVLVSLRVGNGVLDLPANPRGLSRLMNGAYVAGGLEKHSMDELRAILQGRQVALNFVATDTAFAGSYGSTPADLELQLQLAAAYLTHPGYRPEAERNWRQAQVLSWPRYDANAGAVWNNYVVRALAGGDKRFGSDPDDGDAFRSFVELKHYLTPALTRGAIEIAVVGDINEDEVIRLVAKTFGALPRRDEAPTKRRYDDPARFRAERTPLVFSHAGEASQALANVLWPVGIDPDADPQAVRVLSVMAQIMRLKVIEELREHLGATYSPSTGATVSSVHPGFGYVIAGAEVKPADVDRVLAAIKTIAAEMRAGEISDDEFSRAVTPWLERLPQNETSNGYWLGLTSIAQTRPELLERSRRSAIEASIRAVTKDDVIAAAKRWLTPEAAQEARVIPAAQPASTPAAN
jgi:zinc protease